MKITYLVIFLSLFQIHSSAQKQNATSADSKYETEEIIYGRKDGVALTLFQVKPKSPNGKAILHILAGSWFSSSSMVGPSITASEQLLDKGYTMFMVGVGSQPRYAIPDQVADVKRAVRYVRYHAKKFSIDPDNIGITGASAGGHLSLVIATSDDRRDSTSKDPIEQVSARVQAAAVYYPPTDFFNWGMPGLSFLTLKPALVKAGISGAFEFKKWNDTTKTYDVIVDQQERARIGKAISPIYAVTTDDPPVFIIHGDADLTVPVQQSKSFIQQYKDAGLPHGLVVIEKGGHRWNDVKNEAVKFVEWFDKYLR